MNFIFFAAYGDPDDFALAMGSLSPQAKERLIILGAIGVVVLLVLCWAAFFRRRPKHRRGTIKRSTTSFRSSFKSGVSEIKRLIASRERDRKRVHHRPRNPTLAERGGLPERRDPSEASASNEVSSSGGNS